MSLAASLKRQAKEIQREAAESAARGKHYRVVRKAQEAIELWCKGRLLEIGQAAAKTHDLAHLARLLGGLPGVGEEDLEFLSHERSASFCGVDDDSPIETLYDEQDTARCLAVLVATLGPVE